MRGPLLIAMLALTMMAAPAHAATFETQSATEDSEAVRCPAGLPRPAQHACQTVAGLVQCIRTSRNPIRECL